MAFKMSFSRFIRRISTISSSNASVLKKHILHPGTTSGHHETPLSHNQKEQRITTSGYYPKWKYFVVALLVAPFAVQYIWNYNIFKFLFNGNGDYYNILRPKDDGNVDDQGSGLSRDEVNRKLRLLEWDITPEIDSDNNTFETQKASQDTKDIIIDNTTSLPSNIVSIHVNQINSNSINEDKYVFAKTDMGLIFGIFDGHAGVACSSVLEKYFTHYLTVELKKVSADMNGTEKRKKGILNALKKTYIDIDSDIVNGGFSFDSVNAISSDSTDETPIIQALAPAISGSCGTVAYIENDNIYVANAGDSKALIGRTDNDITRYSPIPANQIHTFQNMAERRRVHSEHPEEDINVIIYRNRLFGRLMPSRSFGDAIYKFDLSIMLNILRNGFIHKLRFINSYNTPPYLAVEPTTFHYKFDHKFDKFLVLGSDGISDVLSDDEIVEIVGDYYNEFINKKSPIVHNHADYKHSKVSDRKTWSLSDMNAATRLIRNAINGGSPGTERQILTVEPPHSRKIRDDMTAMIIFFGDNDKINNIHSNLDVLKKSKKITDNCFSTPSCADLKNVLKLLDLSLVKKKKKLIVDTFSNENGAPISPPLSPDNSIPQVKQ